MVVSVNICYKYRELVISSLMTIYLVFCKSKAKYHMLCRPLIRPASGKQQRLPNLRERWCPWRAGGWGGACGLRLHRSLKYLIYDNTPAELLISGGESPTAKTHEAEGPVEFQERKEAQPFTAPRSLAKESHKHCISQAPAYKAHSIKVTIPTFQLMKFPL